VVVMLALGLPFSLQAARGTVASATAKSGARRARLSESRWRWGLEVITLAR
jgi:hypothetical protein